MKNINVKIKENMLCLLILCLTFLYNVPILAQTKCIQLFTQGPNTSDFAGAVFLHKKYPDLFRKAYVHLVSSQNSKNLNEPAMKINAWMDFLEKRNQGLDAKPELIERLKESYFSAFVLRPEDIPQNYFDLQVKIALEQGHGIIVLTPENKKKLAHIAIQDQKDSLNIWLTYFLSDYSSSYPMWAKYWAFMSLVKLGKYEPVTGTFKKRSRSQVAPFAELNREAFALVVDAVLKKLNKKKLDEIEDPIFLSLLEGTHFGHMYGRALQLVKMKNQVNLSQVEGKWITYKKGSNHLPLVQSLQGMNTGWCTAGEATAKSQLDRGDFHVYYSTDKNGIAKFPRIAIRMDNNEIAEIRGVADNQNIDTEILRTQILDNKLATFGNEAHEYKKKSSDMSRLTMLEVKQINGDDFTLDELRFLYEIEGQIVGFGDTNDPRIEELRNKRNLKQDMIRIYSHLNLKESDVSVTEEEAMSGQFKIHIGRLTISHLAAEKPAVFPEVILGDLSIKNIENPGEIILPKTVKGYLLIDGLNTNHAVVLPQEVTKIWIWNLKTTKVLDFTKTHVSEIGIVRVFSPPDGLIFADKFDGALYLRKLTWLSGTLTLPKSVGTLNIFGNPENVKIIWPTNIEQELNLSDDFDLNKIPNSIKSKMPKQQLL